MRDLEGTFIANKNLSFIIERHVLKSKNNTFIFILVKEVRHRALQVDQNPKLEMFAKTLFRRQRQK